MGRETEPHKRSRDISAKFIINFLLTTPHHIFLWNYSVVKPGRCVFCLFPQSDLPLLYQLDRLHNDSSCPFPSSQINPCFEKILIIIFDTKFLRGYEVESQFHLVVNLERFVFVSKPVHP